MDGDRRGETVCVGGRFVPMNMDMAPDLSDMPDMVDDQSIDLPVEMSCDARCDGQFCGVVDDPQCPDTVCACGPDAQCQSNQCVCPMPVCDGVVCGTVTNACGVSVDCSASCDWGQVCSSERCVAPSIVPAKLADGAQFGWSLAVSDNMLAVGAPNAFNDNNRRVGAVYLFEFSDGQWVETATLYGEEEGERFGHSVDFYKTLLVVGAPNRDNGSGRVYLFRKSRTWLDLDELSGFRDNGRLGTCVRFDQNSLSVNNVTLWASRPDEDSGHLQRYRCDAGERDCNGGGDISAKAGLGFGLSMDAEPEQSLVAVGHPGYIDEMSAVVTGRVLLVNRRMDGVGVYLPSRQQSGQHFGGAVQIHKGVVVAAAPDEDINDASEITRVDAGAVYWFDADKTERILEMPQPTRIARFGASLSLDETYLLVGAPGVQQVFVYGRDDAGQPTPTPQVIPYSGQSTSSGFGHVVVRDAVNKTIFVSAPDEKGGVVYLYQDARVSNP